jgi:hypothetical protein
MPFEVDKVNIAAKWKIILIGCRILIPSFKKDYFFDKKKYNFFSRSNFTQR